MFNNSYAEISENQALLLEGSGFAVTEEQIKFTEIDLGISSHEQRGSTINFVIEDGFLTLDDEEFIISELEGKFLREGRYIRINGNIESSDEFDTTISFFGRLVAESKDASIYGFTGRITTSDDTYKIIYTTKLSTLSKIVEADTIEEPKGLTISILKGASLKGVSDSYIGLIGSSAKLGYFSNDRISIEPGTTITMMNNDVVSHSILSGKENYGDRHNPFDPDGRISTGDIAPGKSINITFHEAGFYRLYDPDYPWMKIIAYVFPSSDSLVLRQGQNLGN
ncbi:hypothetical protein NKOR_09585 [Candidatus Nitrosopumilus koreensis AR1]|uniref:Blue (type 1) copper domain-containing protein n=1 Tax=Candidatus Nitrosopumilus koreensis AR1 TaxID=1229908 RepID=K0BBJ5_9ARCH|nr:hypothetical protein NKOR_09585 [Candidatus Nitrosopumilus koreensis AR1]